MDTEEVWKQLSSNLDEIFNVTLVDTENAGRGLETTEEFQRNDIVWKEIPLVVGPPHNIGPYFCANCSQPLNVGVLQGTLTSLINVQSSLITVQGKVLQ